MREVSEREAREAREKVRKRGEKEGSEREAREAREMHERLTLTRIALHRCAKRNVPTDSSRFSSSWRRVAMKAHLQLPVSEFCNSRVSFESRYGTWAPLWPDIVRALSRSMTDPRAQRDWLMALTSS